MKGCYGSTARLVSPAAAVESSRRVFGAGTRPYANPGAAAPAVQRAGIVRARGREAVYGTTGACLHTGPAQPQLALSSATAVPAPGVAATTTTTTTTAAPAWVQRVEAVVQDARSVVLELDALRRVRPAGCECGGHAAGAAALQVAIIAMLSVVIAMLAALICIACIILARMR